MSRRKAPSHAVPVDGLGGLLLPWYDATRRKLPWRGKPSPYRTWVSEIMLQQTRVATVAPYFERFLRRFPDAESLASAHEDEVLSNWAGLGYYSRARNLHRAAQMIVAERGGKLPETLEGLLGLPGIGRYTAAAIASIAFRKPYAVVDGNVIRVYARLFALRGNPKSPALVAKIWNLAQEHLQRARPGDFNQAVMELGATVCMPPPEPPRCGACPLARCCRARALGLQARLPSAAPRPDPVALRWTALWIETEGRVLLWKRGAQERFLPGHWGLPEARHLPSVEPLQLLRTVRHSITHHRILLAVRQAIWRGGAILPDARWVRGRDLSRRLVSSLWRKAAGLESRKAEIL